MHGDFLTQAAVAALGAQQFSYSQTFIIGASAGGVGPLFAGATPSTAGSGNIPIDGGLHFFTERVFIGFPTCYLDGTPDTIDDGVCRLTLQLQAGGSVPLSNNPILLSLMGVPGRQNVPGSLDITTAGAPFPSVAPHIQGWRYCYFLKQGGKFTHNFSNLSNLAAQIDVCWVGWNIPSQNCAGSDEFWKIVSQCQPLPHNQ